MNVRETGSIYVLASNELGTQLLLVRAAGAAAAEHLGVGHRDCRDGAVGELLPKPQTQLVDSSASGPCKFAVVHSNQLMCWPKTQM